MRKFHNLFFPVVAVVSLLTVGLSVSAEAVTLNFGQTHVAHDGSTYYAKGYWTIDQGNGTRYKVAGMTKKTSSGGNSGYWYAPLQASSGFCISGANNVSVTCQLEYYGYGALQGTLFNSSYWNSSTRYKAVQANSKTASAGAQSCVDVRFWIDPCSAISWTNGIQYRH